MLLQYTKSNKQLYRDGEVYFKTQEVHLILKEAFNSSAIFVK
jgi:hypothetical protein